MEPHDLLTPKQISAECVCLNTQRAARAVARRYDAAFRPIGLTSGQFSILAALNQQDAVSIGLLADILGLERTTLTRNLTPLEAMGLVRSQADGADKRVRAVALTPAGHDKLRLAMPHWAAAQASSLAAAGAAHWPKTQATLQRLGS